MHVLQFINHLKLSTISKISVIIPCFNDAKYLSKCIESVLSQTFSDFELLLLNDGSTDHTLTICERYSKIDTRIRVYSHPNKGVSYTRNRGIKLAQGEYILFIDGDDWIKNDYLEKHFYATNKDAWVISGLMRCVNDKFIPSCQFLKLIKSEESPILKKKKAILLFTHNSLSSPCCKMYQKKILIQNKINFDETLTYQEDILFNLDYLCFIEEINLIDYFGYIYVSHKYSSTSRFHPNLNHIDRLLEKLQPLINTNFEINYLKRYLFDSNLKRIINIFHFSSDKSKEEKIRELKKTFQSKSFKFSLDYIKQSDINFIFKTILKTQSIFLIYLYFSLLKKSKKR